MGRITDPDKRQLAYMLYQQGEMNKVIAERIGVSVQTLSAWIEKDNWKEKRAAKTITRQELVNKALNQIGGLLDDMGGKDAEKMNGIADKLSKMVSSLMKLDKKNSVVDEMDTFMSFNQWLKRRLNIDKELSLDLYKSINHYQDAYVNERLSQK